MLLGDFNSIYIGDTSIDAVYIGSDLVWSSSPSPYTQLTYIQSTNCQTINTGYTPNENSRIEAEFMLYTSVHNEWGQALFGNGSWKMYYNRNRALRTEYQFGSGSITTTASVLPYHKQFKLVCDKNGATWYDTEGVQIGNVSVTGTSPVSSPLYIGSDSNSYYSEYRIYSFKVYEGDTLVMNLTPVQRNEDGACGLLDTISMNFFVDAGREGVGYYSDKFEDSYTQLEAVETSGNLYVDTAYVHKINTKFVIDSVPDLGVQIQSPYVECLFGSCKNDAFGSDIWALWSLNSPGYPPRLRRGGTSSDYCDLDSMDFTKRSTITVEGLSLTMLYEDGTSVQKTHNTGTITNGINTMYIFSSNTENNYNQYRQSYTRLYSFAIYETTENGDTIIHNFTPVKRKFDNIIVLYDTVSNSEYPPVGGAFTGWSSNIFDTLTFTGGWLDTNGVVQHQKIENYGTSDFFEYGNNTKVRVSFTQRYNNERLVMLCAYDENKTFIGSAIYESTSTLGEKEFIGEIPSGAVYLRYSYLWGKTSFAAGDLNTVIQLGS